ncbi:hypothetical protein HQO83_03060 [Rhodococcus fascians]|nr:hypothetical protein [Rhodococcus fascians]
MSVMWIQGIVAAWLVIGAITAVWIWRSLREAELDRTRTVLPLALVAELTPEPELASEPALVPEQTAA